MYAKNKCKSYSKKSNFSSFKKGFSFNFSENTACQKSVAPVTKLIKDTEHQSINQSIKLLPGKFLKKSRIFMTLL